MMYISPTKSAGYLKYGKFASIYPYLIVGQITKPYSYRRYDSFEMEEYDLDVEIDFLTNYPKTKRNSLERPAQKIERDRSIAMKV